MQDNRREIPAYPDPFCGSPLKQTEIPTQANPRKIPDSDIDSLEQDINLNVKENSPHHGVILKYSKRPDKSYFQEPSELQGLVITGKLV